MNSEECLICNAPLEYLEKDIENSSMIIDEDNNDTLEKNIDKQLKKGLYDAFDELRNDDRVFGIICIDLNYLKLTNDKYGHQEGDRLLVDFAKILSATCTEDTYTVGRMGGDEFAVIIPATDKATVESVVDRINKKCDEVNADRTPLPISFAYGYCMSDDEELKVSSDTNDLVERVYNVADERMYRHKAEMKAWREAHREELKEYYKKRYLQKKL